MNNASAFLRGPSSYLLLVRDIPPLHIISYLASYLMTYPKTITIIAIKTNKFIPEKIGGQSFGSIPAGQALSATMVGGHVYPIRR